MWHSARAPRSDGKTFFGLHLYFQEDVAIIPKLGEVWDLWTIALISKTKNNRRSGFELKYFFSKHGSIESIKNGKAKQVKAAV